MSSTLLKRKALKVHRSLGTGQITCSAAEKDHDIT